MQTRRIDVDTSKRRIADLSDEVRAFCWDQGDGLLSIFVPHSTAGLAVIELGSRSDADLERVLEALLPRDNRYEHAHGSPGNGADHLLPAFLSPSLTVPVQDGRPMLGVWQSIVLVDLNLDNPQRQVQLSFLGG